MTRSKRFWSIFDNKILLLSRVVTVAFALNKKLHESEKNFHLLISGIRDYAIITLNSEGIVTTWNEGAERIIGYSGDEIIGKSFSCFFLQEDRDKGKPLWELERAIENGRYEEEAIRIRKDGSQFWSDIIITPLYDQSRQLTGFSKVTRDITEKKQTIQALEEQAALFDLFNDAIIVRNLDGSIRYWNRGAEKMYGYTEGQAIEKKTHNLLKTEQTEQLNEIEREILSRGRWDGELVHHRQDGQRIIIESRQALKTDAQGEPTGIVEINTDITARKEAEQKQLALAEMERVNAELEQFAYIAAHDLQEPLRAVAGCLQILEKTYKGCLDEKAAELIQYAVDGAVRMRSLINDLLELSQVNREEMTIVSIDMESVLAQVHSNLESAIEESKATITYNQLPVVFANSTLLTMLFQNLIGNAIKFRSNDAPHVHVEVNRQDGKWQFSVKDNGIGFEQKYASQIFKPFKRLHGKDKYPGTGIGLPICRRIIERHGGKIWAESEPGAGTTFHFTIAIAEALKNGNGK